MIEQLDDILEQLANKLGVYGAHHEACETMQRTCRICFVADLKGRILNAVEIERKLA